MVTTTAAPKDAAEENEHHHHDGDEDEDHQSCKTLTPTPHPDHISALPDELLSSILTFLPTAAAVRTTVLSKRWLYIWKSISDIRFSYDQRLLYTPPGDVKLREAVDENTTTAMNRVIGGHVGPVRSLRLSHYKRDCGSSGWDSFPMWMEVLKAKGLCKVTLRCRGNGHGSTEPGVFAGKSIRILRLRHWAISDPALVTGCSMLTELKLRKSTVDDDGIAAILESCRQLKILSLDYCGDLNKLNVTATSSLQHLTVRGLALNTITINSSNLESFVLDQVKHVSPMILIANNLKSLFVANCMPPGKATVMKTLANIPVVNKSYLPLDKRLQYSPFTRLRKISVEVNLNDKTDIVFFSFVLTLCLELWELVVSIKNVWSQGHIDDVVLDNLKNHWKGNQCYVCLECMLRVVTVRGFRGLMLEVEFVKLLLRKSALLEKLYVFGAHGAYHEERYRVAAIWKKLMSRPRASSNLEMQFKDCK